MHRAERPTTKRDALPLYAAACLSLLAVLLLPAAASAQWTQPDASNNISNTNTTGNVGVGTAAPTTRLQVAGDITASGTLSGGRTASGVYLWDDGSGGNVGALSGGTNARNLSVQGQNLIFFSGASYAERMRITSGGNVGIGTASPSAKLHLSAANGEALRFTTTGNSQNANAQVGVSPYGDSTGGAIYLGPNFYLSSGGAISRYDAASVAWGFGFDNRPSVDAAKFFRVAADGTITTPFMIGGGGNVGVGTASPNASLHVAFTPPAGVPAAGAGTAINGLHLSSANGSFGLGVGLLSNGNGWLQAQQETTSAATYNLLLQPNGGSVGIGTTVPAYRLDVAGSVNSAGLCLAGDCKTAWSQVGGASQWTTSGSNVYYSSGGVGVGIANVGNTRLNVQGADSTSSNYALFVQNSSNANLLSVRDDGNVGVGTSSPTDRLDVVNNGAQHTLVVENDSAAANATVGFFKAPNDTTAGTYVLRAQSGGSDRFIVRADGNVGVGTANPTHTLEVNGTINASQGITGQTINATYQDVAEWVPSSQKLSAGTVVVLDTNKNNHVLASTKAYDTGVAGVISDTPGVILGQGGADKVKVATTGRVKVRVDATRAPIHVGDLLVTSEVEGVAMKSVPVDLGGVRIHRPGTIIGKALEPLDKGTGEILVLLSLQ